MQLPTPLTRSLRCATASTLVASGLFGLGSLTSASPAGAVPVGAAVTHPTLTIPAGAQVVTLSATGGGGGIMPGSSSGGANSGGCGLSETFMVTPGDTYSGVVGQAGASLPAGDSGGAGGAGWTRGGDGGDGGYDGGSSTGNGGDGMSGAGGGGSTAIIHGSTPLMVAAGGGGTSGQWVQGGDGCQSGTLDGGGGDMNVTGTPASGAIGTTGGAGGSDLDSNGNGGGNYPNGSGGNGGSGGQYGWGGGGGGGGWAGGGGGGGDYHSGSSGGAGSSYLAGPSSVGYPVANISDSQNGGNWGSVTVTLVTLSGISSTTGSQGTAYSGQIQGFVGTQYFDGTPYCTGWPGFANCPARIGGGTLGSGNILTSGGNRAKFTISPSLPAGLSLNASTGVISGTPTYGSNKDYTVTGQIVAANDATKVFARSTGSFHLSISGDQPAFTCSTPLFVNEVKGQGQADFSSNLTTWNSPAWTSKGLKDLGIDPANGQYFALRQRAGVTYLLRGAAGSSIFGAPVVLGAITGLPANVKLGGGDVDASTGSYYVNSTTGLYVINTTTRAATAVSQVPANWRFGKDIAVFGGYVWTVTKTKVAGFKLADSSPVVIPLAKSARGAAGAIFAVGDGNSFAWIRSGTGTILQITHLTDSLTPTVVSIGAGPSTPPVRGLDGAGACFD